MLINSRSAPGRSTCMASTVLLASRLAAQVVDAADARGYGAGSTTGLGPCNSILNE